MGAAARGWRRAWREDKQERARLARIEADLVRAVLAQAKQLGGGADIGRSVAGPLLEGARADSSVLPAAGETAQRVRAALLAVGRPDTPELVQGSRLLAAAAGAVWRHAGARSELEQRGLAEELRRWAGETPGRGPARPYGRDRAG